MKKFIGLFILLSSYCVYILYAQNNIQIDSDQVIQQVIAYQMPDIIERCQKDFGYTDEDMQIIEQELKRFLILSILTYDLDNGIGMYSKDVDNLWHTFILFTKEYATFCIKYNNKFIHHIPTLEKDKRAMTAQKSAEKFRQFITLYENTFKEEVHPIWFLDACEN